MRLNSGDPFISSAAAPYVNALRHRSQPSSNAPAAFPRAGSARKDIPLTQFLTVTVTGLDTIRDMPDTWSEPEYHALLDALEVDGTTEMTGSDLEDMLLMALQDLDPEEAADTILAGKLGDTLSRGARQNIVQDFIDEQRPWEEAADISLHARIFAAAVLLQKAFPARFSRPDMMRLTLRLTAHAGRAAEMLHHDPQPAFVARILADGMNESSTLERLFDDNIESSSFPQAASIIWRAEFGEHDPGPPAAATLTVYSSDLWLKSMEDIDTFESDAHNDKVS